MGDFIEILEGWWYRQVINILTLKKGKLRILSKEINDQIDKIRDGFKRNNLPIDDEIILEQL